MNQDIFIIDGVRTPIGATFKGLKNFTAAELGGIVIKEILSRNKIPSKLIDQVILGNTVSAGIGQNVARQAAVFGGLPSAAPTLAINNVCGSGLQAVILGAQAILAGDARCIVAGGTESATHAPYFFKRNTQAGKELSSKEDSLIFDGLFCQITQKHMGQLAEDMAEKYKISRKMQDAFSFQSHQKAVSAQAKGYFKNEIISVGTLKDDERPRKNINLERLSNLPSAFKEKGTVTAGNSSYPSDGAAAVLLASKEFIQQHKLKPKARILSYDTSAVDPKDVFTASIPSIERALKKAKLSLKNIDFFEISEAFAVQTIVNQKELKIPSEKLNIFGGDVALGHPLGATGTRILITLLSALQNQKKNLGLASVCLGGGGAVTVIIEKV